ncbi:hypothetical protein NQ317_014560 [Molorchus minor]|uniref:Uncharacterized protein n=1 Tax=Molorchus minor TaxID=1323400 RepID=A0ABQ9JSI8_9CUCU|nr:hypothetical protein NQ317_014560 [Molorchus minor]
MHRVSTIGGEGYTHLKTNWRKTGNTFSSSKESESISQEIEEAATRATLDLPTFAHKIQKII